VESCVSSPRPWVTVFATVSLDGRLAPPGVGGYKLSCAEDFELQHRLRAAYDAVGVGANTVILDDPRLTVRLVPGRNPVRVVFDSSLRAPPIARVFQPPGRRILVTRGGHPRSLLEPYLSRGVEVIEADDTRHALLKLRRRGIRRLLIEGGGALIASLLEAGVVDEVRVTIAPRILGNGPSLARLREGFMEVTLALVEVTPLCGGWVHLVYRVREPKWPCALPG